MKTNQILFSLATFSVLGLSTLCEAQTYYPGQQYSAPRYNSVPIQSAPIYNSVPQYGTQQQYGVPQQYNRILPNGTTQVQNTNHIYGTPNAMLPTATTNVKPAWYQTLVKDRDHNFGIVAKATKQEHVFEFENTTGNDLYLTSVRTSCGCTKPKVLTPHVKPGENAKILAAYDTMNFYGQKGATVTVSVQKSGKYVEYGELQMSVKGFIRRDVVMNPGEFTFNDVNFSEAAQRTASVLYAGNPQWKILEVKSTNPNLQAQVREIERNPANGRVNYEFVVKLKGDQAAGPFNETLTIVTNDKKTSGMPVKVTGNVKRMIQVSPIQLGVVNRGQKIKKKLILNSNRAISVKEIKTNDSRIVFEPGKGEKSLHILTYTLDTSESGQIDDVITIVTNDPGQPETKVPFSAQIVPATVAGSIK